MSPPSSTLPFNLFPPSSSNPSTPPSSTSTSFSVTSPFTESTDIWRKPTNPAKGNDKEVRSFNSKIVYKKVRVGAFKRVRVSVKAEWRILYDQGGLVLVFGGGEGPKIHEPSLKWIKAGIEFYNSTPYIGHVACEKWADWSLTQAGITPEGNVTIELEKDPKSGTLWIYSIGVRGERFPIREVTWAFADENLTGGNGEEGVVWVGAYACTPIMDGRKGEGDALTVGFEGWELDVEE